MGSEKNDYEPDKITDDKGQADKASIILRRASATCFGYVTVYSVKALSINTVVTVQSNLKYITLL